MESFRKILIANCGAVARREAKKAFGNGALLILEAMKMEQTVRAAESGIVEAIKVRVGDVVSPGDVLMRITPGEGSRE